MAIFVKSVWIDAPVGAVFHFHEREDALTLLSPSFPTVRVLGRIGGIETGARVDLRVGGFRWVGVHTAYQKNAFFVDEQVEGPFAEWIHRHEFASDGGRTGLTDRIEYRLKGGRPVNWLFGWLVNLGLRRMFTYRHKVTKRICEEGRSE